MPTGRSFVTPSLFKSTFDRMLNGKPLFACRMIPIWLWFQIAAPACVLDTWGATTADSENVCVWLNGVTPLSRSKFDGSDARSSLLPTT